MALGTNVLGWALVVRSFRFLAFPLILHTPPMKGRILSLTVGDDHYVKLLRCGGLERRIALISQLSVYYVY